MSNFHHTCEIPSIRIDDGHILRCRVAREDGEYVDAEINLNSCIGNDNGEYDPSCQLAVFGYNTNERQATSPGEARVRPLRDSARVPNFLRSTPILT